MPEFRHSTVAGLWILVVTLAWAACSRPAPSDDPASFPAPSVPEPTRDIRSPGSDGQPWASARTWLMDGGFPRQAWFLCDGIDSDRIMVVGLPDASKTLVVVTWTKASPQAPTRQTFTLGDADPGAGQIYWPLNDDAGRMQGNLHAFNAGALGDPAGAFTPTFTSLQIGALNAACRWVARVRLLGFSDRRTFLITEAPDGQLAYQTFDFKDAASAAQVQPDGAQRSTAASLEIRGGQESVGGFIFRNQGYTYTVSASPAGASVSVVTEAGPVQRESLIAWTLAPRR